jgi:hypothetical protein
MPDTDAFGEKKPRGLLARLLSRASPKIGVTVRRAEILDLLVATERAEGVQAAVDEWLRGHGITAATTVEPKEDGKSRIHARLGPEDAAKLDLSSESVQSELEDILANALH